nr:hypothetical protein [Mycobacterium shigaense]MEA1120806.1 hypothetical protein [Mycobacterium shigaense]
MGGLGDIPGVGSLGHAGGAVAGLGQADGLGTLSVPPSWADALGAAAPTPVPDAGFAPGGWGRCRRRHPATASRSCRWAGWSGAIPTVRSSELASGTLCFRVRPRLDNAKVANNGAAHLSVCGPEGERVRQAQLDPTALSVLAMLLPADCTFWPCWLACS